MKKKKSLTFLLQIQEIAAFNQTLSSSTKSPTKATPLSPTFLSSSSSSTFFTTPTLQVFNDAILKIVFSYVDYATAKILELVNKRWNVVAKSDEVQLLLMTSLTSPMVSCFSFESDAFSLQELYVRFSIYFVCHLFVICHLSFVVRRLSFVVCRSSFVVCRSSFVVRRSSFVVCCFSRFSLLAPHSLFLVPRSSFLVPCSSFLVPRSLFLVPRSSFLVPRSSFLVPRSSFLVSSFSFFISRFLFLVFHFHFILVFSFLLIY
jgi:hypothetical protein